MITKELTDFIKKSKAEGHSDQSIKDVLTKNGWLFSDVEEGLKALQVTPPPMAPSVRPPTPAPSPSPTPSVSPNVSSLYKPASAPNTFNPASAPNNITAPSYGMGNAVSSNPQMQIQRDPQVSSIASSIGRPQAEVKVMPKKSHKGMLAFLVLLLFLAAMGAGAFYFRNELKTLPVIKDFFPQSSVRIVFVIRTCIVSRDTINQFTHG